MNDEKLAELREKYKNRNLREELRWGAYANHNGYTGKTNAEFLNWLCNAAYRRIKELEENEKWIPVGERLPEENMACLVSVGKLNFRQLAMYSDLMGIKDHKIFYQGNVGYADFEDITEKVNAWMPLPKPYKGEKDEKNN